MRRRAAKQSCNCQLTSCCVSCCPPGCGKGYLYPDQGTGWDVAAMPDSHPDYAGSCGRCYEVKCESAGIHDGYGQYIDRNGICKDESASVVITITDTCPCVFPTNYYSNKRWCCGDMVSSWEYNIHWSVHEQPAVFCRQNMSPAPPIAAKLYASHHQLLHDCQRDSAPTRGHARSNSCPLLLRLTVTQRLNALSAALHCVPLSSAGTLGHVSVGFPGR